MPSTAPSKNFVPIKDIENNIIIRKDGTLVGIVLVNSINFALKSPDERAAILFEFQNMLNSLGFSVQILIQSRRENIAPYIQKLRGIRKEQKNSLLQLQTTEYIKFIQEFTKKTDIMSKNFFVVVTYKPLAIKKDSGFSLSFFSSPKKKKAEGSISQENHAQLEQRIEVVRQSLSRIGLKTVQLGQEALIDLIYQTLNPYGS